MSTKWTFVHVVLLRYDAPYEKIRELLKKYLTSSRQMRIIYFVSQRGGFPRCSGCGNSSVVEHHLAKVGVASSSLVFRSIFFVMKSCLRHICGDSSYRDAALHLVAGDIAKW